MKASFQEGQLLSTSSSVGKVKDVPWQQQKQLLSHEIVVQDIGEPSPGPNCQSGSIPEESEHTGSIDLLQSDLINIPRGENRQGYLGEWPDKLLGSTVAFITLTGEEK